MDNSSSSSLSLLSSDPVDADTDSEFETESDIADQHEIYSGSDDLQERDMPCRPTSRLGFNRTSYADMRKPPHRSRQVSRSLLPTAGSAAVSTSGSGSSNFSPNDDLGMDITALASDNHDSLQPRPLFSSSTHRNFYAQEMEQDDGAIVSSSSGEDEPYSDSDSSSDEFDDIPEQTTKSGSNHLYSPSPRPGLPIAVPFPTKPIAPASDLLEPAPRAKFSCLPSPLSPAYSKHYSYPSSGPSRHSYGNHGYSRYALFHLKWFWGMREDEWEEYNAGMHSSTAYGGLSFLYEGNQPDIPLHSPGYPPANRKSEPQLTQQLPPMTIHPRRGDLAALRDPYCMHIDRCFVGLPVWTLAKTLWMFDIHKGVQACTNSATVGMEPDEDNSDNESEGDPMDTSTSADFSDDSDVTLVESDNEGDPTSPAAEGHDVGSSTFVDVDLGGKPLPAHHIFSDPGPPSHNNHRVNYMHKARHIPLCPDIFTPQSPPLPYTASSHPTKSRHDPCWDTNWYKRWELLVELTHLGRVSVLTNIDSTSPSDIASTRKVEKSSRFFFAGESEEAEAHANPGSSTWTGVV